MKERFEDFTEEELAILRAAGWLHDVGKFVTTALRLDNGDEVPLGPATLKIADCGQWHAIGHEKPKNFKMAFRCVAGALWGKIWRSSRFGAKTDWLFVCLSNQLC